MGMSPREVEETMTYERITLLEQPGASAVWLGVEDNRMHLDRERVKVLIRLLVEWLDTGEVHGSCYE